MRFVRCLPTLKDQWDHANARGGLLAEGVWNESGATALSPKAEGIGVWSFRQVQVAGDRHCLFAKGINHISESGLVQFVSPASHLHCILVLSFVHYTYVHSEWEWETRCCIFIPYLA